MMMMMMMVSAFHFTLLYSVFHEKHPL